MKIAVLTSGILPTPAVKGGAVENLIDFYLEYNEQHRLHDITVYSVSDLLTARHPALQSTVNHYHYIEIWSVLSKIRKHVYKLLHGQEYYHYTIEYYLHQAMKDIAKQDYDLIIIENRPAYGLKLSHRTKAKLVYHLHNDFLNNETLHGRDICKTASRIITVSDFIASRVRTIDNVDGGEPASIVTVHNGIDLDSFSNATLSTISRSQLGLDDDDFVIVYSGRMNAEKGIAELVEALRLLRGQPKIKLLVVGGSFFGNSHQDNTFTIRLKTVARPLSERIVFTGFIPYSEVPAYLRLADLAVIPSQWEEPFGLTCVEAMAMGLPIIATRQGGIPETLHDDYAILLSADCDFVEQLAETIYALYRQPEKRQQMGQAALEASHHFSKQRYAEAFFKAISDL
jgi:glycosyltransferase involved in cell wall biosynthesis